MDVREEAAWLEVHASVQQVLGQHVGAGRGHGWLICTPSAVHQMTVHGGDERGLARACSAVARGLGIGCCPLPPRTQKKELQRLWAHPGFDSCAPSAGASAKAGPLDSTTTKVFLRLHPQVLQHQARSQGRESQMKPGNGVDGVVAI